MSEHPTRENALGHAVQEASDNFTQAAWVTVHSNECRQPEVEETCVCGAKTIMIVPVARGPETPARVNTLAGQG